LRARPEPTQLEHLSDASFLGKLLVFPANVRLDWKVIASTNTLAYSASSTVTKEKCFKTLTPDEKFGANGQKIGDPNGQQVISGDDWNPSIQREPK